MEKTTWNIDPTHSEVLFKVKHMMISTITGHFNSFEGEVVTENENFENGKFSFELDVNSIDTNNSDRDTHLKSEEFFKAESFPKLTFTSTSYDGNTLKGELTIRDVTKQVSLDMEYLGTAVDPYEQTKAGFEITGKLNRKDFNLSWDAVTEAGNVVVSDTVKLIINAQLIKQ